MKTFFHDARHYQLLFLSAFLTYGLTQLDWDTRWQEIATLFLVAIALHSVIIVLFKLPWHNLKSTLISCLSLSILFKADHLIWYAVAASLMVLSKFIVKHHNKHFVNPANFAIMCTIIVSGHAWISPGQWGAQTQLIFLIGALGFWVSSRVQRMDVALAFFGTFLLLQAYRTLWYLHWPADHLMQQFSTGSLLLFTFFMITDPVPSPKHPTLRILWGMGIGAFSFVLANYYFVQGAPLWALFAFSFITPLINTFFKGNTFEWKTA
jgi:Na+-transporting NADH:ubiquinone oxidoreductase subunit NqrB